MLAQSSSFLDSGSVGEDLSDDFAADGPLFAELFEAIGGDVLEADENINIVNMASDSEDEMEKYLNNKISDSESTVENNVKNENFSDSSSVKSQNPKVVLKKLLIPNHSVSPTFSAFVSELPHKDSDSASLQEKNEHLCMNKNAVAARHNRQKKKHYMKTLEQKCETLSSKNFALKAMVESKDKQLKSMAQEIEYLRNVLANQTGLSALLKNIQQTSGLNFGTSFTLKDSVTSQMCRKRSVEQDHSSAESCLNSAKRQMTDNHASSESSSQAFEGPPTPCASPEPKTSGGVCLHVSNNNVSLEFCAACASSAAEVWKVSGDHTYNRVVKQEPCDYVVVEQAFCDSIGEYTIVKQEDSD